MSFDLATLDQSAPADRGAWCTLRHPVSGDDLPIKIKIAGEDSQVWVSQERKIQDGRLDKAARRGTAPKMTSLELEKRQVQTLAIATMEWQTKNGAGWEPYIELDGQQLPFNTINAERLYGDKRFLWLRRQLGEFAGDPTNYDASSDQPPSPSLTDADAYQEAVAKNS